MKTLIALVLTVVILTGCVDTDNHAEQEAVRDTATKPATGTVPVPVVIPTPPPVAVDKHNSGNDSPGPRKDVEGEKTGAYTYCLYRAGTDQTLTPELMRSCLTATEKVVGKHPMHVGVGFLEYYDFSYCLWAASWNDDEKLTVEAMMACAETVNKVYQ